MFSFFKKKEDITILHVNRKSLIKHAQKFLSFCNKKHRVLVATDLPVSKILENIRNSPYVVVGNGTDEKDREIVGRAREMGLNCKFIFGEFAWYNWRNNIYFDECGIGKESFLFDKGIDFFNTFDEEVYRFYYDMTMKSLMLGDPVETEGFAFIPMQVDGDSKIVSASPRFRKVDAFLTYVVKEYLKDFDGKIYIKKHPSDPRTVEQILPSLKSDPDERIEDISERGYSKFSLLEKSKCLLGINSTFLMESIFLNKRPVSFGLDIFSNKGLTIDGNTTPFEKIDFDKQVDNKKFVYGLMSRQINRKKRFNRRIMKKSYWYRYFTESH